MLANFFRLTTFRVTQWLRDFQVMMLLLGLGIGILLSLLLYALNKPAPALIVGVNSAGNLDEANGHGGILPQFITDFRYANDLLHQDRCEQAMVIYQQLLAHHPKALGVLNNLAYCLSAVGKYEDARSMLEQAIEAQTTFKVPHRNLTQLYAHLAELSYNQVRVGIDIRNSPPSLGEGVKSNPPAMQPMSSFNGEIALARHQDSDKPIALKPKHTSSPLQNTPAPNPSKGMVVSLPRPQTINQALTAPASPSENAKNTGKSPPVATLNLAESLPPTAPLSKASPAKAFATMQGEINKALQKWANAWSKKNLNLYFDAYASGFVPPRGQSLAQWRDDRISKIGGKKAIAVSLTRLRIEPSQDHKSVRVQFHQAYVADDTTLSAVKVVRMVQEKGQWKIIEENVK